MVFLLDTNVVSELRKPKAHPNVEAWLAGPAAKSQVYVSVLVVGEIRAGIEKVRRRGDIAQAQHLEDWLAETRHAFRESIVGISSEAADAWGRMDLPRPSSDIDGLMAATALVNGWTFVTRDTRQLERTGVRLFNPFED